MEKIRITIIILLTFIMSTNQGFSQYNSQYFKVESHQTVSDYLYLDGLILVPIYRPRDKAANEQEVQNGFSLSSNISKLFFETNVANDLYFVSNSIYTQHKDVAKFNIDKFPMLLFFHNGSVVYRLHVNARIDLSDLYYHIGKARKRMY